MKSLPLDWDLDEVSLAKKDGWEWIWAPHDCDMCPSNVREESIDGFSLEWGKEQIGVWNLLEDTAKPPQSVNKDCPNDRFRMASHWECFVAEWRLPRPTRKRGCCELSSAEVVCHAGSGVNPFVTLIRCRSLCCFKRVRSVRIFRDRLSGGWASGNWGRTSVRGYTRSQLFRPAPLRTMRW